MQRTARSRSGSSFIDQGEEPVRFGSSSDQQERRILRRKSARRAVQEQAEQPIPMSVSEPEDVVQTLPAPIGPLWDRLPFLPTNLKNSEVGRIPLLSSIRKDPATKAFDVLRSRLLHTLREKGWKRVAVVAPTTGCGTTFTAVNLALSLARVRDARVVLMDMNQTNPGVARALGADCGADLNGFLAENLATEDYFLRASDSLVVGLANAKSDPVAEVLHSETSQMALQRAMDLLDPDVMLFDMPAVTGSADFLACLPHVDGVLVVSDGTQTTAAHIARIESQMRGHAALLGVVLNKARVSDVSE
jgi:Mrp family chromosome partitioning ATPase